MIFSRDNLVSLLRDNVATITFTKVDGSERVMRCTLLSQYMPSSATNNGEVILEQPRRANSNNVSVWDIDANGWRSFRVSSIKNVSIGS